MPVRIGVPQRIVADVSVLVQSLRISNIRVRQRSGLTDLLSCEGVYDATRELIWGCEATLSRRVVSRKEIIQARLPIPFLAGTTGSDVSLSYVGAQP